MTEQVDVQPLFDDAYAALAIERERLNSFYDAKFALDRTPRADKGSGRTRIENRIAAERDHAAAEALADAAQERTRAAIQQIEVALGRREKEGE